MIRTAFSHSNAHASSKRIINATQQQSSSFIRQFVAAAASNNDTIVASEDRHNGTLRRRIAIPSVSTAGGLGLGLGSCLRFGSQATGSNFSSMPFSRRNFSSGPSSPNTTGATDGLISNTLATSSSSPTDAAEMEMAKFEQSASAMDNAQNAVPAANAITDSSSPIWQSTWWPQDQMLDFINFTHDFSGMNYAYTIAGITLAFRTVMVPIFISGQRNTSKLAHLKPEMDVWKAKIDALDPKDTQGQQQAQKHMAALLQKYDVNPLKSLIVPLVQMPVFMSMFFALKKMPDYFGPELSNSGILWFTDLSAPDPNYILPVTSALSFLLMMELGKEQMMASNPQQGKVMITVFRALAVAMVPLTMNFSSAIFVYWTTNNTFSLLQSVAFQNKAIKKSLGIWEPPKPLPGAPEPKGIVDMMQDYAEKKSKEHKVDGVQERIKKHNDAVNQELVSKMQSTKKSRRKGRRGRSSGDKRN